MSRILYVLNRTWGFRTDWQRFIPTIADASTKVCLITDLTGSEKLSAEHREAFHDVFVLPDLSVHKISKAIQHGNLLHEVDSVRLATTDERLTLLAAEVRARLTIPGDKPEVLEHFRDKVVMKHHLLSTAAAEIAVPKFCAFEPERYSLETALAYGEEIIEQVGLPLIAKPRDAGGSRGVIKISTFDELLIWMADNHDVRNYEFEQYIAGDLFNADLVVVNGEIQKTFICSHPRPNDVAIKEGKPMGSLMMHEETALFRALETWVSKVYKSMQPAPKNSVFDMDFILDKDGVPYFIEMAARSPGGKMKDMYQIAMGAGFNIEQTHFGLQFEVERYLTADYSRKVKSYAGYLWVPRPSAGQITHCREPIFTSPATTVRYQWKNKLGDQVEKAKGMSDVVAEVVMHAGPDDHAKLEKDFHLAGNFSHVMVMTPAELRARAGASAAIGLFATTRRTMHTQASAPKPRVDLAEVGRALLRDAFATPRLASIR